ncbi:Metallo-dependent hydrolase [Xylariomycetidae sp. FL2044]|nr:Metallo-dependent hydrolase [Xylariomycetidae sp. FL2044]
MGSVCSIDKGADSDQNEKDLTHQPSTSHHHQHSRSPYHRIRAKMSDPATFAVFKPIQAYTTNAERSANAEVLRAKEDAESLATEHFSKHAEEIKGKRLLSIAQRLPKGAHLHLHFNATLLPGVLLGYAKNMPNMYITSVNRRLLTPDDFANCEIQFMIMHRDRADHCNQDKDPQSLPALNTLSIDPDTTEHFATIDKASETRGANLFRENYQPKHWMRYQYFREMWAQEREARRGRKDVWTMDQDCDAWLISKIVFSKEDATSIFNPTEHPESISSSSATPFGTLKEGEAEKLGYSEVNVQDFDASGFKDIRERAARAWEKFDVHTRMMKGLFNYETAFRQYTRACLEEFVRDNVLYAEIRPNFMETNQIWTDDGKNNLNNTVIMEMIIDEYQSFMKDIGDMTDDNQLIVKSNHRPSFGGLKVIYCTPRSFGTDKIRNALKQCIEFKERWPQYIAGFDLVGEEAYPKPKPLKAFEEEFKIFQDECRAKNLDIPFLFHCGETPDDIEGNLDVALEFDAKRVGHGYALLEKKAIMKEMVKKDVCVETCPISNMVLGLAGHIGEHRIYDLLRNSVHCAVSSDNGTLFGSTLSHDFFEVMIGNKAMDLYGWKQLAQWSIDHSCMDENERRRVQQEWKRRWDEEFVPNVGKKDQEPRRLAKLAQSQEVYKKRGPLKRFQSRG